MSANPLAHLDTGPARDLFRDAKMVLTQLRALPASALTVGELIWLVNIANQLPWCESEAHAKVLHDEALALLAKASTAGMEESDADR